MLEVKYVMTVGRAVAAGVAPLCDPTGSDSAGLAALTAASSPAARYKGTPAISADRLTSEAFND